MQIHHYYLYLSLLTAFTTSLPTPINPNTSLQPLSIRQVAQASSDGVSAIANAGSSSSASAGSASNGVGNGNGNVVTATSGDATATAGDLTDIEDATTATDDDPSGWGWQNAFKKNGR